MFVERAAAAGDHVLNARCISLTEHCAETNVAEVYMQVDWPHLVKPLKGFSRLADFLPNAVHCCALFIPEVKHDTLFEQPLNWLCPAREMLAEAAIVMQLA